jgi:hypothetical protein
MGNQVRLPTSLVWLSFVCYNVQTLKEHLPPISVSQVKTPQFIVEQIELQERSSVLTQGRQIPDLQSQSDLQRVSVT